MEYVNNFTDAARLVALVAGFFTIMDLSCLRNVEKAKEIHLRHCRSPQCDFVWYIVSWALVGVTGFFAGSTILISKNSDFIDPTGDVFEFLLSVAWVALALALSLHRVKRSIRPRVDGTLFVALFCVFNLLLWAQADGRSI